MLQPLLAAAVVAGASMVGHHKKGPFSVDGLGAMRVPEKSLCFFEIFDGQNAVVGAQLMGSPIKCASKSRESFTAIRKNFKKYRGRRGDPSIVCKFSALEIRGGVGLGLARNCERV
jgi:hypothetical protein